jgi:AmmeMemoRadiSam system protein A
MPENQLSQADKTFLLRIAREAMENAVEGCPQAGVEHGKLSPILLADGASFVTLTVSGDLRGCIGALEPYQPLVDDVQEHAIAAALEDFRFPPVQAYELKSIKIEISRLSTPMPLEYVIPEELITRLRPNIDGVILREGRHRATFLPQVWEKLPKPRAFLSQLSLKMGAPADYWTKAHLEVFTYQVEEFHE